MGTFLGIKSETKCYLSDILSRAYPFNVFVFSLPV